MSSMKKGSTHTKNHNKRRGIQAKYETVYKNDSNNEFYATVEGSMGNMMFKVIDNRNCIFMAKAMGSFAKGKNKEFITIGATVLVQESLGKYFIQHLYSKDEVAKLGFDKNDNKDEDKDDLIDIADIADI